jgi:hypothetical protein
MRIPTPIGIGTNNFPVSTQAGPPTMPTPTVGAPVANPSSIQRPFVQGPVEGTMTPEIPRNQFPVRAPWARERY